MYDESKRLDDGILYRFMQYETIRQTQVQLLSTLIVRGGDQH